MFHPGISSKQKGNYASPYTFISFCCRRNDELTTFFSHLYEIDSSIVLAENYIKKVEEIVSINIFYLTTKRLSKKRLKSLPGYILIWSNRLNVKWVVLPFRSWSVHIAGYKTTWSIGCKHILKFLSIGNNLFWRWFFDIYKNILCNLQRIDICESIENILKMIAQY